MNWALGRVGFVTEHSHSAHGITYEVLFLSE